ncbi:MAG: hypothetical protein ABIK18_00355 [candidate division WOR-3 bacterium]
MSKHIGCCLIYLLLPLYGTTLIPEVSLGYRGERGVEAKGILGIGLQTELCRFLSLEGGFAGSFIQHNGVSGYAVKGKLSFPNLKRLSFNIGLAHNQWNDWQAGENSIFSLFFFQPDINSCKPKGSGFATCQGRVPYILQPDIIGLGVSWRQPVFDPSRFTQPWIYTGGPGEWNLLYLFQWQLFQINNIKATAELSNYNLLEIKNPQQLPFGFRVRYWLSPSLELFLGCRTAINGLSTFLISFPELHADIGVKYGR